MADIFLSYARDDWERIRPLAQSLEALGWSVWWDTRMRAGRRFDEMIEAELAGPPSQPVVESAPQRPKVTRRPPPPEASVAPAAKARGPEVPEPEMVRIEPGTLLMGSVEGEGYDEERPQHEVRIARPFGMGRYPATFEEYEAFAKATKRTLPGDEGWGRGRRPVINVSWEDAAAYAQWLSEQTGRRYRLPSEAEWEYAACAGTPRRWSFGNGEGELGGYLGSYAWYKENSEGQTHPVGEKEPNSWGLYDVHGNVWEWVQDCWHESYQGAPNDGNAWLEAGGGSCGRRVVRGGSWNDDPGDLRSANRFGGGTGDRNGNLGFRLAQDL